MAILARRTASLVRRLAFRVVVVAAIAVGVLPPRLEAQTPVSADSASLEYEVKAAYLLNFARYADWPPGTFKSGDSPLVICVIGQDPFRTILDRVVAGQAASGRPVRIQRASLLADARGCQVAFISPDARSSRAPRTDSPSGPMLTVGEGSGFARHGGMIGLVIVDSTVRFEVNLDAVRRSGLELSSRVLALATRVYTSGAGE